MIGIKRQTDWYLEKSKQLDEKHFKLLIPKLADTVCEIQYNAMLLEAYIEYLSMLIEKHCRWT